MAKIIIHESGRKTVLNDEMVSASIEVRDKKGKVDKPHSYFHTRKDIPKKELEKMMEKPQEIDAKKHGAGKEVRFQDRK